ncbi:hypothetical protein M8C21_002135, partial [Ambrosia artemisiifolia]
VVSGLGLKAMLLDSFSFFMLSSLTLFLSTYLTRHRHTTTRSPSPLLHHHAIISITLLQRLLRSSPWFFGRVELLATQPRVPGFRRSFDEKVKACMSHIFVTLLIDDSQYARQVRLDAVESELLLWKKLLILSKCQSNNDLCLAWQNCRMAMAISRNLVGFGCTEVVWVAPFNWWNPQPKKKERETERFFFLVFKAYFVDERNQKFKSMAKGLLKCATVHILEAMDKDEIKEDIALYIVTGHK